MFFNFWSKNKRGKRKLVKHVQLSNVINETIFFFVLKIHSLRPQTCVHTLVYFSTYLTVFGGWAGAFLIPLDWDRPWQVWPITCTYGAIGGYLLGLIFCLLINLFNLLTKDKLKI